MHNTFFSPNRRMSLSRTIALTMALTAGTSLFLTSCKPSDTPAAAPNGDISVGKNSTASPYETFSRQLEKSVNESDPNFINAHFSLDTLIQKVVGTVNAPEEYRSGFAEGIKNTLDVGQKIVHSLGIDGHYKFLQLRNMPHNPTALFRLNTEEGVNYHEIYLRQQGDSIIIDDLYIYEGGMSFSNTLKRVYFASLSTAIKDISFEQTSPFDKGFIENLDKIDKIAALVEKNNHREALKVLQNLPEIVRIDKMVMVLQLKIAKSCDPKDYQQAIDDFRNHYPSDPVLEFMCLENALEKNKADDILTAIDQLDTRIGGDVYLNVLRADVAAKQKNYDLAEKLLLKAKAAEPDNEGIYWHIINIYLAQKQYEKTVAVFSEMKNLFGFSPEERLPQYEFRDFWKSKPYLDYAKK